MIFLTLTPYRLKVKLDLNVLFITDCESFIKNDSFGKKIKIEKSLFLYSMYDSHLTKKSNDFSTLSFVKVAVVVTEYTRKSSLCMPISDKNKKKYTMGLRI